MRMLPTPLTNDIIITGSVMQQKEMRMRTIYRFDCPDSVPAVLCAAWVEEPLLT